jgi:hypothetical protein
MDKRYLVVSPVLFGKRFQDEVLHPCQLGDAPEELVAKGAIHELTQADSIRLNGMKLKHFVLPAM